MNFSKNLLNKNIERIVIILLILFGIYVIYQMIKKVLGGSWTTEDIIIPLLIFNLGCTFTIGLALAKLSSDQGHLANQIESFSNELKKSFR